ncbi:MAG: hypothetical protein AAGG81_06015, partial [Chlamydiota bacterium]
KKEVSDELELLQIAYDRFGGGIGVAEGFQQVLQEKQLKKEETFQRIDDGTELNYDVGKVQRMVNQILNIEASKCVDSEKSKVLQLLTGSGALKLNPELFEDVVKMKFKYNPVPYLLNFLEKHRDIKTVLLGCGRDLDEEVYCMKRFGHSHEVPSLRIALDALQVPDVIIDMHNADLWGAFEDNSLESVGDHTNSNLILFDDKHSAETLRMIFRKLKPGGFLQLGSRSQIYDKHAEMLESCGFIVHRDNSLETAHDRAEKPSLS